MADRTRKTRREMTFRLAPSKPRNPLVVPALKRVAGAHRETESAARSAARQALERAVRSADDD